jgi:hypothetical protein
VNNTNIYYFKGGEINTNLCEVQINPGNIRKIVLFFVVRPHCNITYWLRQKA